MSRKEVVLEVLGGIAFVGLGSVLFVMALVW
jgi:hypothetical protein